MRLFIIGDLHGNHAFLRNYLMPKAARYQADVAVQVGDFGLWEHWRDGVIFLDKVADAVERFGIPLFALHGNHDNWPWAMHLHGGDVDDEGFVVLRPGVHYIPQGHSWAWRTVRMRAFGGAYSIDKPQRLLDEAADHLRAWEHENYRRRAGRPPLPVPGFAGTRWFPREEMTDGEFQLLMAAESGPVDVIFSHDRPRGADCGIGLKDEPQCWPNQDRLQQALITHKPRLWLHGHLHHAYLTGVRNGDDDSWTRVMGLSTEPEGRRPGSNWAPWQSWALLDLSPTGSMYLTPGSASTNPEGFHV